MDLLVELKNKGALDNDAESMQIDSDEDTQATKDIGKLTLRWTKTFFCVIIAI